jgi:hypothetical protein
LTGFRQRDSIAVMPIDEQIKDDAERIWAEIKERHIGSGPRWPDFSPQSLWTIENLFEREDEHIAGGLLFFWDSAQTPKGVSQRRERAFKLGAYIGEVVRRNLDGWQWNDPNGKDEEIELRREGKDPLFPIKFIKDQITEHTSGSIVEWGKAAGLTIGEPPKPPRARFR